MQVRQPDDQQPEPQADADQVCFWAPTLLFGQLETGCQPPPQTRCADTAPACCGGAIGSVVGIMGRIHTSCTPPFFLASQMQEEDELMELDREEVQDIVQVQEAAMEEEVEQAQVRVLEEPSDVCPLPFFPPTLVEMPACRPDGDDTLFGRLFPAVCPTRSCRRRRRGRRRRRLGATAMARHQNPWAFSPPGVCVTPGILVRCGEACGVD